MSPPIAAIADAEREYQSRLVARPPSVSIAILTKNSLPLIRNCVESILDKVKYRPTTIMICDTGTDDPQVRAYYDTLKQSVTQRRFGLALMFLKSYHFGRNYNTIAKHVDTDYFLIQNNDTVALNDYVTELVRLLSIRKVASAGPRMLYPSGRIQHDGQYIFNRPDGTTDGLCGHLHLGADPRTLPETEHGIHRVDGNTAAGCLVRTADFLKVGGFDEAYRDIFQDVDLMIRLSHDLGGQHYCHRDAVIVHVDNASRVSADRAAVVSQMMIADKNYLVQKAAANGWRRKPAAAVEFSIITVVRDLTQYSRLLDSLKNQHGDHPIEIIGLPNYHATHNNMFHALNMASAVAEGRYLVYCHEDVIFGPNWLNDLAARIRELDAAREPWGVIGPAGVSTRYMQSHFFLLDQQMNDWRDPRGLNDIRQPRYEVDGLDEMCMVVQKEHRLRFSAHQFTGFHFYGVDLCLAARLRGLKCFAVDARCHHDSDGMSNLASEEAFVGFVRAAVAWHTAARAKGVTEWRSTAAWGKADRITIFAVPATLVPKYGFPMQLQVPG